MRKFVTGILAVVTVWMFMYATEMRILFQQEVVLGAAGESLVCRYLTGRGTTTSVFWYSPSNIMGQSHCALVHTQLHSLRR